MSFYNTCKFIGSKKNYYVFLFHIYIERERERTEDRVTYYSTIIDTYSMCVSFGFALY